MAGDAAEQPKIIPKTYEELGVRLFRPAPDGFNPIEASASELLLHGYPGRPDAQLQLELYQRWKQVMSRSISSIEPQFGVPPLVPVGPIDPGPVPYPGPIVPVGPIDPGTGPFPTSDYSQFWAGSVAFPQNYDDVVTAVAGTWTVPDVIAPAPGAGAYMCATWIGIDGWQLPGNTAPLEILQAGTTRLIGAAYQDTADGAVLVPFNATWAWWEWYPGDSCPITNFTVSPGDLMHCTISPVSATEAAIFLLNKTTGISTPFMVTAPAGVQLFGYCAEWILEVRFDQTVLGLPLQLAEYGSVYFDDCTAQTRSGAVLSAGPGELLTMINADNYAISNTTPVADTLIRVDWASGFGVI